MSESANSDTPKSETAKSGSDMPCVCTEESTTEESLLSVNCECPRDKIGIVIHESTCLLYKHETIIYDVSYLFLLYFYRFHLGVSRTILSSAETLYLPVPGNK